MTQKLTKEFKQSQRQRLTARRHFEWLRTLGYQGQYPAVAVFIRQLKQQYQPKTPTVFIPQYFPIAESFQFDWSQEWGKIAGTVVKLKVAHFRLCHSRAFFIRAYQMNV